MSETVLDDVIKDLDKIYSDMPSSGQQVVVGLVMGLLRRKMELQKVIICNFVKEYNLHSSISSESMSVEEYYDIKYGRES